MMHTQLRLLNDEGALIQQLRLRPQALLIGEKRHIADNRAGQGGLRAGCPFRNGQCLIEISLRRRVESFGLVEAGGVIQTHRHRRMLIAVSQAAHLQRAQVERFRPGIESAPLVQDGEVVEHGPQIGVILATGLFHENQGQVIHRFGRCLPSLLAVQLGQIVQADRDIGVRRAQHLALDRKHPFIQRLRAAPIAFGMGDFRQVV